MDELKEHQYSLKSGVYIVIFNRIFNTFFIDVLLIEVEYFAAACTCLTELCLNDNNVQHIVQANGVYLVALLILPPSAADAHVRAAPVLQVHPQFQFGLL